MSVSVVVFGLFLIVVIIACVVISVNIERRDGTAN